MSDDKSSLNPNAAPAPLMVSIAAHYTPHHNDPPNATEFYAALGLFTVAWGA
jgi:hypothetical protein